MYVCGVTPYDTTHLGHAFTYISYDVLIRYLKYKGYDVDYVQNVTDIDDDVLKRAKQVGKNWKELGEFWTKRFLDDIKELNILSPTHYVKATASIDSMIRIIEVLISKGFAYECKGNVYFEVKKFKNYGQLSHYDHKQMLIIAQERGGHPDDPFKKDPLDFLLWQKSRPKDDQHPADNEPFWESPWSKGRPGWHIECSAMIYRYLGDQIDIHGGGRDLIFPHHESEIAQMESFSGKKPFVKYWVHTAMLIYEGEKMSKSLGNLVMVKDLLAKHSANSIRYLLLSHHYRIPWEFFDNEITTAEIMVKVIEKAARLPIKYDEKCKPDDKYIKEFETHMDNDLDTPSSLKLILKLSEEILNKKNTQKEEMKKTLDVCLATLGFNFE